MTNTIIRLSQVKAVTGLSRSSIYKRIADRSFPRQVQLGPRSVGWLEREVDAWLAGCVAARDEGITRRPQRQGPKSAE
jgi:prophage regulatory protein